MAHGDSPGFLRLVDDARARVRECSIEDFLTRLQAGERFVVIDVREGSEWSDGHVPGAHHMSRGILEREIESAIPDKNAAILLYCGGDHRSTLAADSLLRMGYANVVSLAGGWRAWRASGLPVVLPEFAQ